MMFLKYDCLILYMFNLLDFYGWSQTLCYSLLKLHGSLSIDKFDTCVIIIGLMFIEYFMLC